MRQVPLALATSLILAAFALGQSSGPDDHEWRNWGHDPGGMRFSRLGQIDRSNVTKLQKVWTYHTGEVPPGAVSTDKHRIRSIEATPLVVDGVLYFSTPYNQVIALDAETGKEIWKFDTQAGRKNEESLLHSRGVAYWEGPATNGSGLEQRIFVGPFDGRLFALDARTGKPCPNFGPGGAINLRTVSPTASRTPSIR